MKKIDQLKKGPKNFRAKANEVIDAINSLTITGAYPIYCTVTDTGWVIGTGKEPTPTKDTTPGTSPSASGGGGGGTGAAPSDGSTPGWNLMNMVVETATGYTIQQMWVWSAAAATQSANPAPVDSGLGGQGGVGGFGIGDN